MGKTFSMSKYVNRDDMHRAMVEYIRELEGEKQALKQRLIDAVNESITFGSEGIGLCKTDYIAVSRLNELIEKVFSESK